MVRERKRKKHEICIIFKMEIEKKYGNFFLKILRKDSRYFLCFSFG